MNSKKISNYYLGKKNIRSVSNRSYVDKNVKNSSKSIFEKKNQPNRSKSFLTVKKKYLQKSKRNQKSFSKISSQKDILNQTVKKQVLLYLKPCKKRENKIFLDDRSDCQPKARYFSTPKFGQNFFPSQNLTNNRLSLLFELQTIKKEFNHNLNQISLTCLKRVSPLKQNLTKSLKISRDSLKKEWILIKKSCSQVKNQKENQYVEHMIWQWEKKKRRIQDIERNIEKAFSLLLL